MHWFFGHKDQRGAVAVDSSTIEPSLYAESSIRHTKIFHCVVFELPEPMLLCTQKRMTCRIAIGVAETKREISSSRELGDYFAAQNRLTSFCVTSRI